MTRSIDIALLPAEARQITANCYVVVDELRATTTIATMFAAGIADLLVMNDIEGARRRATAEGRVLCGEVGGVKPEGFDYGNSPLEFGAADVADRGAVLFTTNGTAALCDLAGSGVVVTGSLANLSAVAAYCRSYERVVVVGAGNESGQRFSLEDFAAAGAICRAFRDLDPGVETGDAANLAMGLNIGAAVSGSRHAGLLRKLGLESDIVFAVQTDTSHAVPLITACGPGWALLVDGARQD